MIELKSVVAFLLTMISLIFVFSFILFQFFDVLDSKMFCKNFSANLQLQSTDVTLETGKGRLIKGKLTNTGFDNEFFVSLEGPSWVVVRPRVLEINTNETSDLFVYLSPEFDARGGFDTRLSIDAVCTHLEKTIKVDIR